MGSGPWNAVFFSSGLDSLLGLAETTSPQIRSRGGFCDGMVLVLGSGNHLSQGSSSGFGHRFRFLPFADILQQTTRFADGLLPGKGLDSKSREPD